ncbi:MAG TPA: glycosyltransferase family 2 protein [Microvirga sp.]|jgi:rhamnosyltransferase
MEAPPRRTGTPDDAGASQAWGASGPTEPSLAAAIVVFEPDTDILRGLIAAVAPAVGTTFVFINALSDAALRSELAARPGLVLVDAPRNFGIGEALNILALHAIWAGYGQLILFDQDSRPSAGLVPGLVALAAALRSRGETPAVVGPRLVAPPGHKAPRYVPRPTGRGDGDAEAVHFLPTSGSLVDLDAFRRVGTFRGDYFIDAIDLEWCFRAWARGYSCWCARHIAMPHTVGEGVIAARRLGLATPRQKDFRFETYVRNTVYGFRLGHIPLSWKIRQGLYLLAQFGLLMTSPGPRIPLAKRFARGFLHGVLGRLGPPQGAPFT